MKQSWSTSCVPACALLKQHVSYAFTRRSWSPFIVPPLFHLSRQCVWYKYLKASNVKLDIRKTLSLTIKLSSMSTARVVKWVTYGLSDIVALISERFDDGVCFYITELLSYLPCSCTLYYTDVTFLFNLFIVSPNHQSYSCTELKTTNTTKMT